MELYTTNCPKCIILENVLKRKCVPFTLVDDIDKVMQKGREYNISEVPFLITRDGELLNFKQAMELFNK